jgi:hypothetical protein
MLNFHQVLKSSRAAIDLASIMVGVIVIGLISGVIAATVFTVIPWSQDKAAKQQLDNIHTAENAFFGLSADGNVSLKNSEGTTGSYKNAFAGSGELDFNNLLSLNQEGLFCVIPTTDKKDYHAYSKSGSGKWFAATNSKKEPVVVADNITPCVSNTNTPTGSGQQTPGTVNANVDTGAGSIPIAPISGSNPSTTPASGSGSGTVPSTTPTPTPQPVTIKTFGFEQNDIADWSNVRTSNRPVYAGAYSAYPTSLSSVSTMSHTARTGYYIVGEKYRVSGWVLTDVNYYAAKDMKVTVDGVSSTPVSGGGWQKISVEFTASKTSLTESFSSVQARSTQDAWFYLDNVTVEKIS